VKTSSRPLEPDSCQTHQHKTDHLTLDSRIYPNADSARPHHRHHHSLVCNSCYQSRCRQNLIYIFSASHYGRTRTSAIVLGVDFFSCGSTVLLDPGRLTYSRFLELFRHMVGLLGRVISPSQGLYLHSTTQHKKTRTNIHALSGIRTHDPSNQSAKTHASDRTATVTGIGSR
jgi:hypothetical protein